MDYLRGNASASPIGLFTIWRHLVAFEEGRREEDLRRALQLLRTGGSAPDATAAVLTASLTVGEGLGLIHRESPTAPWVVDVDVADEFRRGGDQWPWFRGELLRRISQQGVTDLESQGSASDLVLGLTWFLQLNPLNPLQSAWTKGPEPLVLALNFDAVSRSEQWLPFARWAVALGLARRSDSGAAKVVIPDASTAIEDQLKYLPADGSSRQWLSDLRSRLPILGSPSLLAALPKGGQAWTELPPAAVLGLLKLEKSGVLLLEPSDDASDVISIGLGSSSRQVGRISVRKS